MMIIQGFDDNKRICILALQQRENAMIKLIHAAFEFFT